jgi:hypothetical protein
MNQIASGQNIPASSILAAVVFVAVAMWAGYSYIGLPPVVIVGGSGMIALLLWLWTFRRGPIDPAVILPPFLLTVACLEVHMIEEYVTGFGPAMSRLFDISWTERGFLLVFAFIGPIIYSLTALGLYWRIPLAGFVACFIFVGPGVAEFTHFIFPLIKPAILPDEPQTVTQMVSNGRLVENMPNYFIGTTGRYYFSGLYTAVLPMVPGIYGIYAVIRESRRHQGAAVLSTKGA